MNRGMMTAFAAAVVGAGAGVGGPPAEGGGMLRAALLEQAERDRTGFEPNVAERGAARRAYRPNRKDKPGAKEKAEAKRASRAAKALARKGHG